MLGLQNRSSFLGQNCFLHKVKLYGNNDKLIWKHEKLVRCSFELISLKLIFFSSQRGCKKFINAIGIIYKVLTVNWVTGKKNEALLLTTECAKLKATIVS